MFFQAIWLRESLNFCTHFVVNVHEATQLFMLVDYLTEMTVKKSCEYDEYGSFEHLLFLFLRYCYDVLYVRKHLHTHTHTHTHTHSHMCSDSCTEHPSNRESGLVMPSQTGIGDKSLSEMGLLSFS